MSLEKLNHLLGILSRALFLFAFFAFLPAAMNELSWLGRGKKVACAKIRSEYELLVSSSSGLNSRAFSPGDGTAINQAFLGTVLASSTQSPNAKLIQATIYGCPTDSFSLQQTSW